MLSFQCACLNAQVLPECGAALISFAGTATAGHLRHPYRQEFSVKLAVHTLSLCCALYTSLPASAADPQDEVIVTARVNNLADTDYADRADFAFGNYRYFPGRDRTVFVEVRYQAR